MTIGSKVISTMLIWLILLLSLSASCWAEKPSENINRFNMVLVVDKSGSLCCENEKGTDPDGLRYDALRQFLGLLTEGGNNVGTIVFDEHIRYESAINPLEGMEAKKALVHTIEEYYPGFDTDIGKAMLRATKLLSDMQGKNNLPCMIVLFSDGMTDFTVGDVLGKRQKSYANAQQALDMAMENGITINGILLNVDNVAEHGIDEFLIYTHNTSGVFEEVNWPEDLGKAFQLFYTVINNTAYTGAERVSFSTQGEANIFFTVPSFGVEEVNVIVEGDDLRSDNNAARLSVEIIQPDGINFDISGHDIESSRYRLVKIPNPSLGIWNVKLSGVPGDWVDVTMVCNASLSVQLSDEEPAEPYRTLTPYTFTAAVIDPSVAELTEEQLGQLNVVLVREELATGAVREYGMKYENGAFAPSEPVSFPRAGEYRLNALVELGDFKVRSNILDLSVLGAPLVAKVTMISDMLQYGQFQDGQWKLELSDLFGIGEDSEIEYTLSHDYNGILRVENGYLLADISEDGPLSFTLTAKDPMDQSAAISFNLSVPPVTSTVSEVSSIYEYGKLHDSLWELDVSNLFNDPKGGELGYTLSKNYDGAVTLEGNRLRVDFSKLTSADFDLYAADIAGQSVTIPFNLSVPPVTAKVNSVSNDFMQWNRRGYEWETALDNFFDDPKHSKLDYSLSSDCDGAVSIDDNTLRVCFQNSEPLSFELTATDFANQSATIPFNLSVSAISAKIIDVTNILEQGQLRDYGWEMKLDELFSNPQGVPLKYSLSNDYGGTVTVSDDMLRIRFQDTAPMSFKLTAKDLINQSATIAFNFPVPAVTAKIGEISNILKLGRLMDFQWEIRIETLFDDPKEAPLEYAVSDDCGGAVTITDGILHVDLQEIRNAAFTLTARDIIGLEAAIPISIVVPSPAASVAKISETIKTGLFQAGYWEANLDSLFREPKGTALTYALSEDFGGAAQITGNTLRVDMSGLKKESFFISATDEYGLNATIPVTLTEKNMTPIYMLWTLVGVLLISAPIAVVIYLRRRN